MQLHLFNSFFSNIFVAFLAGQLLLFYTIFYIILACIFAISMQGLFATIEERAPKWKLQESLIGENPGLGFRPISNRTEEGSLIWYDQKNITTIMKWKHLLDEFLNGKFLNYCVIFLWVSFLFLDYIKSEGTPNRVVCDYDKKPRDNETCSIDLTKFGPCAPEFNYGYNSSSPCVFLKLNRVNMF